jgi:hypothetical protein
MEKMKAILGSGFGGWTRIYGIFILNYARGMAHINTCDKLV